MLTHYTYHMEALDHTAAHILAQAVKRLFPNAKLGIGSASETGFFYDFDADISEKDLPKIEKEMYKIIKEDIPVVRKEVTKEQAKSLFKDEPYKLEILKDLEPPITIYEQGDFVDLCKGPHVSSTGKVKAVKLLSVSGAYWKGNKDNKQLVRIRGVAFPSKKDLENYLKRIEEASKRDHRRIGKALDLFSLKEEAVGMPFFHPKGWSIFLELVNFMREINKKYGFQEVRTPMMMSKELWKRSGHWDHYKENMFVVEGGEYAIKPMNCPGHILLYSSRPRSYKELPIRYAEFTPLHRNEIRGTLHGLMRVTELSQDDAHVFLREDQLQEEINRLINLIKEVYSVFGMEPKPVLSTRPDDFMGDVKVWDKAEKELKSALDKSGLDYTIEEGEGAFYGPKIDFIIEDALGRKRQTATIQLDFQLPERFGLEYEGPNKKGRPIMIHRAVLGSIERFMGIMIEHYAGKFPIWLAPVQAIVLPITDAVKDYALDVYTRIKNDLRTEVNLEPETLNKKIRNAQLQNIPFIIVVGNREKENNTISIRTLDGNTKTMPIEEFLSKAKSLINKRVNSYTW
ncbi:MAG TPA: threonine--tRNA ligase [Candidatus Aenigmarchaeota archaeon]|nr:threonine--tRNA ligase [Candidatus Aenigmarchaeota archaeon]HEX32989.1 threonine--tRNA ligase [Candidatus Aenigmarchaeota archaeon]